VIPRRLTLEARKMFADLERQVNQEAYRQGLIRKSLTPLERERIECTLAALYAARTQNNQPKQQG
jgi:hypothetical protein